MKFGIVVFPGSNCDHDAYHAAKHVLGQDAVFVFAQAVEQVTTFGLFRLAASAGLWGRFFLIRFCNYLRPTCQNDRDV